MTTRRLLLLGGAASALAASEAFARGHAAFKPPVARVAPVTDIYWGEEVMDRYRWMEAKPATKEWTTWLKGQGDFAAQELKRLPVQARVKAALETYTATTTQLYVAQVTDSQLVYIRRDPAQQGYSLYMQPVAGGDARLLIDPDKLGKPGQPVRMTWSDLSPDNRFLAYGLDAGGNEVEAVHIIDLTTMQDVTVTAINSRQSGWLPDSTGFFYQRLRADAVAGTIDYAKGSSVWLHRLGSDPATDTEVFKSGEGPGGADLANTSMPRLKAFPGSDHVLGIHMVNGNTPGAVYVASLADLAVGKTPWQQVCWPEDLPGDTRPEDSALAINIAGDDIYVLARGEASRGQVFKVPVADPGKANRVVVVPESAYVMDTVNLAKDGLYLHELRGLVGALKRYSFADGSISDVALPREGAVWGFATDSRVDGAWFGMDGLTWPAITLRVGGDLKAVDTGLTPLPPYDVSAFDTTRADVPARDGALVPIEIMHRKDVAMTGANPTLIIAYGAYGSMLDPGFQGSMLAFLSLGGVIVYAHVRGGGEKGEDWHKAGMKQTKPNTWRDAIDVAEYLAQAKWTSPAHLALWGTSAGGIMVGRAITERPDLFRAAIGDVGCFNTLRFELTANGPGNDVEFGTFKKEDEFHGLLAMDSYHHVVDGTAYPAVLCITGANDPRVESWVVGKFAARLQATTTSKLPVLLRVDYGSGHHASSKAAGNALNSDIFSFVLSYAG